MEAHGVDGIIAANDSNVTITWKTLRGRLTSIDGSNLEVIPISRIFDTVLISATAESKGCLQFFLIGNESLLKFEDNWMSNLRKNKTNHAVLFNLHSQFQINALRNHVHERIRYLRSDQSQII